MCNETETAATSAATAVASGRGNEGPAAYHSAEVKKLPCDDPWYSIRFDCLDNAAYHGARATWFENLHKFIMGTVVIGSSAVIAQMVPSGGRDVMAAATALVPLIASTVDLVLSPSLKAARHSDLRARFFGVLAEIEGQEPTQKNLDRARAQLWRIYATEPPTTYYAVKAMAYNTATEALWPDGEAERRRLPVPWHHRLLGVVWPFHATKYRRLVSTT